MHTITIQGDYNWAMPSVYGLAAPREQMTPRQACLYDLAHAMPQMIKDMSLEDVPAHNVVVVCPPAASLTIGAPQLTINVRLVWSEKLEPLQGEIEMSLSKAVERFLWGHAYKPEPLEPLDFAVEMDWQHGNSVRFGKQTAHSRRAALKTVW